MTAIQLIGALFFFTLAGGLIHAIWNLRRTRKLRKNGENPYEIPQVYQQYRDPKMGELAEMNG